MRIVDLNVLIYATDRATTRHDSASAFLDDAMRSTSTIGLPTAVTIGFVRLVTNPRVMRHPIHSSAAIAIVRTWLKRRNVAVPVPTERHYEILDDLLTATGAGGNLVNDAHLAALAIEHGAELWSYDHAFGRFPGLRWRRPHD